LLSSSFVTSNKQHQMNVSSLVQRLGNILDVAAGTEAENSWVDYLESVKQSSKTVRLLTILPDETGFSLEILLLTDMQECLEKQVQHMHSKKRHAFRRCFMCRKLVAAEKSWFFRGIHLTPTIYLQIPVCAQSGCRNILEFGENEVPPRKVCAGCYSPKIHFKCIYCKSAYYCHASCQHKYWESHKHMCKKLAKIYFLKSSPSSG